MGLIGRWKLDEASGDRAADSAGNNAGALNGPTWMPQGFPGAKYPNSGSLVFDGVDDFVELGIANLPANNQPQSVTFWFNITTVPLDPQLCVSLTDGIEGGSRLKLGFRAGQVAAWKRNNGELVTGPSVTSGWHHYGYTFDGTRHTLYIDGIQAGTSTVPADTGAVAKARLGAGHSNAENFTGQLDEVRLYGHALTAAEIAALHEGIE
jgi:large repetitive protein